MGGYITWSAIVLMTVLVVIDIINGQTDAAFKKLIEILLVFGIGRKIEKTADKVADKVQVSGEVTQKKVDDVQATTYQTKITGEATQKTAEKIEAAEVAEKECK